MTSEKAWFDRARHTDPDKLSTSTPFTVRLALRNALLAHLTSLLYFHDDVPGAELVAEQLAFLPELKSGWGPDESEIQQAATDLADCYVAHRQLFTREGFQDPALAAVEALKAFDFAV